MLAIVVSSHFRGIINNQIHRGFLSAFPGRVLWYGPGEERTPNDERLGHFVTRARPDLVLVNMKKRVRNWLQPEELAALHVPKAMIECDFYTDPDEEWYRRCAFTRVFFRSYLDARGSSLPATWLPFSVHPSWIVTPQERDGRKPIVTYAGNRDSPELYPVRTRALKVLYEHRLMEEPAAPRYELAYMKWWRGYAVGLTCGSKFQGVNAKHFIIPAAGAALLTDGPPGTEQVFPDGAYWRYAPDCSDLVERVHEILDDPRRALVARRRMHAAVVERHTHAARWGDLLRVMQLQ